MSTKERLAAVLRAEGLNRLALNADNGMYDDFESQLATPIVQLVMDLRAVKRNDLAQRAIDGEWDGTKEEGDAWFEREGRKLLADF
jgi:hypothetical protein